MVKQLLSPMYWGRLRSLWQLYLCRLAEAEGPEGEAGGSWARLAELELRCMKLQREAQESRGAVLDARAALRRCEGERAALHQVLRRRARGSHICAYMPGGFCTTGKGKLAR